MPQTTYYFLAFFATAIAIILAGYAWKRRDVAGALAFAWLMAGYTECAVVYAFSIGSPDLETKFFWIKLSYLGISTLALAWLIFTLQYTGQGASLTPKRIILLAVVPAITLLLVFTSQYQKLMWTRVWFDGYIRVSHGAWYWVFIAYSYILSIFGMWRLVRLYIRSTRPYRSQAGAIILGGLIFWAWDILYLFRAQPATDPNLSFIVIILSGVAFGWGLFRYRLLDIVPIARGAVIESMSDGMLVVDEQGRVIDLNPTAQNILGHSTASCIGTPLEELFPTWREVELKPHQGNHARAEIALQKNNLPYYFDVRVSPLTDRHGKPRGRLILFTDVNERKRAEMAEREQRAFAEALRDSASALNSTLQLDEVLDRILTNTGRVVPSDAVNIMLIKDGVAQVVRGQGYTERNLEGMIKDLRLKVAEVANLNEMINAGQPVLIGDVRAYPGWDDLPLTQWIRSYAGAPIRSRGETIGFINLDSAVANFFTPVQGERLQAFADQAAVAIENARLYEEVHQLALTDSLTGLWNRRSLFEQGRHEVDVALRLDHSLSAIMIDVDHFKQINDTYGHPTGDQVLLALVKYLRENVRSIDLISRYGGDEFLILLLESDIHMAYRIAERLRRTVSRALLLTGQGSISITISLGVSTLGLEIDSLDKLIDCADQAMYSAKEAGRNRASGWSN